ncbi:aminotransferase, class V [Magnetococcus marinus MC-1]|uniref:cysteine desulfurase n=1 Tax=Magnetococcus marinus (strain ATCC BAA-1437 / JCM 17883 / MC-1) TaxID=156889 RepID=A0L7Z7_MAGMM|nr:IscS subfamily cysteine desulfurase [Magnetococcus marinus]ABK44090.1 aminotransferase, class V [Magnetococcus marinus MC-1]
MSQSPLQTSSSQSRDGMCGICPAGCWVRVHYAGETMVAVEPRPDHPLGMICRIGRKSPNIVYDPQRLQTPLKRVGPKGSYAFEPISWDEAMATIASRLQQTKAQHGAEATAIYTGRGSFDMAMCDLFQPADVAVSSASSVLFPFGSPNTLGVGALCYVSFAMIAPHVTFGEMLISLETDLPQSELIVLWGANPATDSPPMAHGQILAAKQRGAEVLVIDPRRSESCVEADAQWYPIRPGTDGALALGMIHVLIEEELYDENFVKNWTLGFEELAQYVQHFHPDVVAEITGVPAEQVRNIARKIANAAGACPVMYTGLEYSDSGVQAIRAVFTLWALAGQLDVPGGLLIRMKENQFPQNRTHLIKNPGADKALGRDRFPVYSAYRGESHAIALPQSVLQGTPYKVRDLIVLGGSLITSWPDPELWKRTLNALEFLVVIDRYHTADSAYADIVLPATTLYECRSFMRYGPMFAIREKLVPPVGEARNDFLILAELAQRLGYGHLYPQTEAAILERALEGSGFTLEQVQAAGGVVQLESQMMQYKKWEKGRLREDGKPGFATPSGKFEIASSLLVEHGYDALPVYTEPQEGPLARPDLARHFPLVLNTGARTYYDFRSQHHGVKGLAEQQPDPRVTMNHEDAAQRGIQNGDWVWVSSPRGEVKYRARVTDAIVKGSVDANMGGGGPVGPAPWQACNVNALTDPEHYDPISGFPIYKTLLCQIRKAADADAQFMEIEEPDRGPTLADTPGVQQVIYLDHNATTPMDETVIAAMRPYLESAFGNPSSIHGLGVKARHGVEAARRQVAQLLGSTARRIIFTGGGSEADNLALRGVVARYPGQSCHIITSAVEHPAILACCAALARQGHRITYLPVDAQGVVNQDAYVDALTPQTTLVSIMAANNETGTLQPIQAMAAQARAMGVLFHSDGVQALGKIPLNVDDLGVDLLSLSAHKIHGPKGVGALYLRKGVEIEPLIAGGSQEWGLRAGTENVAGIVGFGKACERADHALRHGEAQRLAQLRDRLEDGLLALVPGAKRNGPPHNRLPNTLNLTLPGIRGESLVLVMERQGVYFSSGSACKSGNPDPSHALLAMGISPADAHCSVRFSLGSGTTLAQLERLLALFKETLADTMGSIRFVSCR